MKIHPIADILPRLTAKQFADLKASIEANGLMTPLMAIERDGEQILIDGRHRLRACEELKIKPVIDIYDAEDHEPGSLVWGANGIRRHLSPSQRAAFYSQLCGEPAKEHAKARKERKPANSVVANLPPQKARDEIAKVAGVSARTVQDALTVQKADPELFQQIKDGTISVSAAAKKVRPPKPQAEPSSPVGQFVASWRAMGDGRLGAVKELVKAMESHERHVLLDWLEQWQE